MNECDILMAALDIDSPDERGAYLDKACGKDTALRQRVETLLDSHAKSGSLLEHPAVGTADTQFLEETEKLAKSQSDEGRTVPGLNQIPLDFLEPSDQPDSLGRLGQYDVREVVGRGGMGIVLKAHDTKLSRVVALKVLAPELAANATARKRFLREARAAAAVSHDHVVTIYAVEENEAPKGSPPATRGGPPYLAMEFIDGESLEQKIDREGHLELKEILRIGRQVAAGLAAAHEQGLIHRDIKPSNILLQNSVERVQITDFGLARAKDDVGITRTGEVAGTPQYMSPEQAEAKQVDERSDLFSLGSVLYAMCTGRSPFRAETTMASLKRVCEDTPRPIRQINPDVPEWLVVITDRLLEKDPDDRFQSAEEVCHLLAECLAHVQDPAVNPLPASLPAKGVAPRTRPSPRAARAPRGRRWAVAAAVLIGVFALVTLSEATGVTHLAATIIRIATGEGTLVIEVDDPTVEVSLDGEELSITGAGIQELRLRPGQYQFQAMKDGEPVKRELVSITRGGRQVVRITREAIELGLQGEGGSIRPLEPGYISLFDGKTFNGWQGDTAAYSVENEILICSQRGRLFTNQQFSDFVLQFEFRLTAGANGGVGVRVPMGGHPSHDGFEIQILDDSSFGELAEYLYHGSIWGVVAADRGHLKPTGEWNHQELRCLGKRIKVRLNGILILDADLDTIDDPPDGKPHPGLTRKSGHIVLMGNRGRTDFRNIQIRDLSGEETAFVVLSSEGAEVSKFKSLSDAVASSSAGDTIEIRGNGPFVTDPVVVVHPLTIRAGDGFRPVVKGNPEALSHPGVPLLSARSPLVLEGIELKYALGSDRIAGADIVKAMAPLHVANCRFAMLKSTGNCVRSSSSGVLQNCEIVNIEAGCSLDWATHSKNCFLVENCVLTGMTVVHRFDQTDVLLQLNANTIVRPEAWDSPLGLVLNSDAKAAPDGSPTALVRIVSSRSILDSPRSVLTFSQSPELPSQLDLDEVKAQLPRLLQWREEKNLYRSRGAFLQVKADAYTDTICDHDLGEWNRFWGLRYTGSLLGVIRYKGAGRDKGGYREGNLYTKVQFSPEKLTPRDFRLRPGSAGYQAGPDGKDLGADIDLVGPGEAYERWKQTPEYQEWQKETRELIKAAVADQSEAEAVSETETVEESSAADSEKEEPPLEDSAEERPATTES